MDLSWCCWGGARRQPHFELDLRRELIDEGLEKLDAYKGGVYDELAFSDGDSGCL